MIENILKMKKMWLYENSKMKATYIRKSSTLYDMKNDVYKSLGFDPQQF